MFARAEGSASPAYEVATLRVLDGESVRASTGITAGEWTFDDPEDFDQRFVGIEAGTIAYDGAAPVVELLVTGVATVTVDVAVIDAEP